LCARDPKLSLQNTAFSASINPNQNKKRNICLRNRMKVKSAATNEESKTRIAITAALENHNQTV